ncbi:hypothetical protein GCM10011575_29360 [Microlunatus endophyticus]|uniref:Uncharacterized protein n=1 Tax=Microlunatus endophyticus TaxID=1716077 RepID=A0A917SBS8_9ACTN|nr:hypothetical protein GCM10011575_29360 [Microlunatus endophyticus]
MLATLERRFGLDPLTKRDAAAPDVGAALTLTTPRDDDPLSGVTAPTAPTNPTGLIEQPSHLQEIQAALIADDHGIPQSSLDGLHSNADYSQLRTAGPLSQMRWDPHHGSSQTPGAAPHRSGSYAAADVLTAFAEVFHSRRRIVLSRHQGLVAWVPGPSAPAARSDASRCTGRHVVVVAQWRFGIVGLSCEADLPGLGAGCRRHLAHRPGRSLRAFDSDRAAHDGPVCAGRDEFPAGSGVLAATRRSGCCCGRGADRQLSGLATADSWVSGELLMEMCPESAEALMHSRFQTFRDGDSDRRLPSWHPSTRCGDHAGAGAATPGRRPPGDIRRHVVARLVFPIRRTRAIIINGTS